MLFESRRHFKPHTVIEQLVQHSLLNNVFDFGVELLSRLLLRLNGSLKLQLIVNQAVKWPVLRLYFSLQSPV